MLSRCGLGTQIAPTVVRKFVPGYINLLPLDVSRMVIIGARVALCIRGGGGPQGLGPRQPLPRRLERARQRSEWEAV